MADISVVMDKLQGFETADELAEFFRGYGIKAHPRSANNCAISKFVKEETGITNVSTSIINILSFMGDSQDETRVVSETTNAMADFIGYYDTGCYPDLVEDGYPVT